MTLKFKPSGPGRYLSTCRRFRLENRSRGGTRRWLVYDGSSIYPTTSKKLAIAKARELAGIDVEAQPT